jgi:hypothetical protein
MSFFGLEKYIVYIITKVPKHTTDHLRFLVVVSVYVTNSLFLVFYLLTTC